MVGRRLHRVDERPPGRAAVRRPRAAASSVRARLLRPARPRGPRRRRSLARAHGIYGFCFYYYWFNGRRFSSARSRRCSSGGEPDFPFCFCWANENWTRRWDGAERDVLLAQDYSPGWEERFIRDVLPALADRRYIRVGGAPLLLVYRADVIPDVERALESWREIAADELGLDLHLAAVQSFGLRPPAVRIRRGGRVPAAHRRFLVDHDQVPGVDPGSPAISRTTARSCSISSGSSSPSTAGTAG